MSIAIDVNILLYASDAESPHHKAARAFVESCAEGSGVFCLAWTTVMAYLRMATHPTIFRRPLTPEEAMANMDALLACPQARVLAEGDRFWNCYRALARGLPVRGNLVPDAHLAALLHEHGIGRICTHDADFRKFPGIAVVDPCS
jgi:toxin-antitoxin system PIN domain toxin